MSLALGFPLPVAQPVTQPVTQPFALFFALAFAVAFALAFTPAAIALERHSFRVLEKLPLSRDNFVQGLQIVDDVLYLSSGMYGESRLTEYAFPKMTVNRELALPPKFFAEGVTRVGDKLYQLTWREGRLIVHDAVSLSMLRAVEIPTEGWGITSDGEKLFYSDGTHRLYILDPKTLKQRAILEVTLGGRPLPQLNELEWINGEIWANVWRTNQLVRINPDSGEVVGIVDLRGLLDPGDRRPDTDVLNGIAWDASAQALWVTGKRWPWLYKIELVEFSAEPKAAESPPP